MHTFRAMLALVLTMAWGGAAAQASMDVTFSTYVGGSQQDTVRDVVADAQGNVYVTGGTLSPDFPTTPGAYQRTLSTGGAQIHDVFVMKLDPSGRILWSTLVGGPNYDRAYAIEVDRQGFVYIAGRAGAGFPVTPGAFQTTFGGGPAAPPYGPQDGFVCKLTPDGSALVFCSYVGQGDYGFVRDLAVDQNGDVYLGAIDSTGAFPPTWFANAFQPQPRGREDGLVVKVRSDGAQVLWATYLGGSGIDGIAPSIRVDAAGYPYVLFGTDSPDLPITAGAYDGTYNGMHDLYVAKLTPDGAGLVFATYLGGSQNEFSETHGLALDGQGNVYVAGGTSSPDFPTTAGAWQRGFGGPPNDGFVAKLAPDGTRLLASTFLGGSVGDMVEGIALDVGGNVFLSGGTMSADFPVTSNALQRQPKGNREAFAVKLASDLSRALYATYLGGAMEDGGRTAAASAGRFYLGGTTQSTDWPTRVAAQAAYAGNEDGFVVAFSDISSGSGDADGDGSVTDTDGVLVLRVSAGLSSSCTLAVCDVDGDGQITDTDGANVLRAAVGLPSAIMQ